MNKINKRSIASIGYDFIPKEYIPKGKNEYYLRNIRSNNAVEYRSLTAAEIEILVRNNNASDNWNNILVSALFNPQLVKNCSFFGLVRIGKLETISLEFHNLNLPVGLYNSTIISCDFGDNVCVHNVNYFSHFVVENEVMIANVTNWRLPMLQNSEMVSSSKVSRSRSVSGLKYAMKMEAVKYCPLTGCCLLMPFYGPNTGMMHPC